MLRSNVSCDYHLLILLVALYNCRIDSVLSSSLRSVTSVRLRYGHKFEFEKNGEVVWNSLHASLHREIVFFFTARCVFENVRLEGSPVLIISDFVVTFFFFACFAFIDNTISRCHFVSFNSGNRNSRGYLSNIASNISSNYVTWLNGFCCRWKPRNAFNEWKFMSFEILEYS